MAQHQPRDFQAIQGMWNNPHLSDVIICIGDTEVHAHKAYLSIASEYFQRMFAADSQFAESQSRRVELRGDDPKTLERCMKWIYGYPIAFEEDGPAAAIVWMLIWKTADKYMLRSLCADALSTLKTVHLTARGNLSTLIVAAEHCHSSDMPYGEDITAHIGRLCKDKIDELLMRRDFYDAMEKSLSLATQIFEYCPHVLQHSGTNLEELFNRAVEADDGTMVYNMLKSRVWNDGLEPSAAKGGISFMRHVIQHRDGLSMVKAYKDLCAGWLLDSSWPQ